MTPTPYSNQMTSERADCFGDSGVQCRMGAIGFINTVPVFHAFQHQFQPDFVLHSHPPASLNKLILAGDLDISPVSSACYLRNQDQLTLLPDLSVSSFGAVESVIFVSRQSLNSDWMPEKIAVPDDSETSIALLLYLLQQKTGHCFNDKLETYPASDYQQALDSHEAVLIIGDNALILHEALKAKPNNTLSILDLSSEWVTQTELPFVFAVWVARTQWLEQLQDSQRVDVASVYANLVQSRQQFYSDQVLFNEGVASAVMRSGLPEPVVSGYYTQCLNYELTSEHQQSLEKFETVLTNSSSQQRPYSWSVAITSKQDHFSYKEQVGV